MKNASAHKSSQYRPCGSSDFQQDESLGKRCTSNKQNGLAQLGYTQLCVVHGTVSLRCKKDGAGELQLWYRAMLNDCRLLYASRIAGDDEMVCELLMYFLFHFQECTDKISKIKTLSKSSRNFISSNTENKQYHMRVLIKGFRPGA